MPPVPWARWEPARPAIIPIRWVLVNTVRPAGQIHRTSRGGPPAAGPPCSPDIRVLRFRAGVWRVVGPVCLVRRKGVLTDGTSMS